MGAKYLWGKYCSAIYWELYYTIMGKPFFPRMESSRAKCIPSRIEHYRRLSIFCMFTDNYRNDIYSFYIVLDNI